VLPRIANTVTAIAMNDPTIAFAVSHRLKSHRASGDKFTYCRGSISPVFILTPRFESLNHYAASCPFSCSQDCPSAGSGRLRKSLLMRCSKHRAANQSGVAPPNWESSRRRAVDRRSMDEARQIAANIAVARYRVSLLERSCGSRLGLMPVLRGQAVLSGECVHEPPSCEALKACQFHIRNSGLRNESHAGI